MDYKKKHKEEIIRATQLWECGDITRENLEYIFPELKESENEKMVKFIKKQLFNIKKTITDNYELDAKLTMAIEWLDKQGDKDKLIQELGKYKAKYTQDVLEKHINSMINKDDGRLRKTTIAFLKEFAEQGYENAVECIDWLEKQAPKPKWTEEDEDMLESIICHLQDGRTRIEFQYEIDWLKSIKKRMEEQQ